MINPKEKHKFFRTISKMMQDDPNCPATIRVDFAAIDKMDDIRTALTEATGIIGKDHDAPMELKKEWLEYLTCVEAGIRSFLDAHAITLPKEDATDG